MRWNVQAECEGGPSDRDKQSMLSFAAIKWETSMRRINKTQPKGGRGEAYGTINSAKDGQEKADRRGRRQVYKERSWLSKMRSPCWGKKYGSQLQAEGTVNHKDSQKRSKGKEINKEKDPRRWRAFTVAWWKVDARWGAEGYRITAKTRNKARVRSEASKKTQLSVPSTESAKDEKYDLGGWKRRWDKRDKAMYSYISLWW